MNELADTVKAGEPPALGTPPAADRANRYVARILQQHLVDDPGSRGWTVDGTAAFVDVSGFTALSEDRDPEEVRDLLTRYFDTARETIGRYGGTVEKFIGDAVMVVWGTPVAHEDD